MPNYENGKIYRIICNTTGKQYIGSTTQPLSKRLGQHKRDYKRFLDGKNVHCSSFEIMKNNDCEIFLLEEVYCKNREELLKAERHWIEKEKCVNINASFRYEEERKDMKKDYQEVNKEYFSQLAKERYRTNIETKKFICECGSVVINLTSHLQTDKHLVYMSKRQSEDPLKLGLKESDPKEASEIRKLTKAEIPGNYRQICECGVTVCNKFALEEHLKTQRHLNLMKEKEERLNPTPKPEPFKEFSCECGMVIKQIWHVKPHLQSKKHLDDMRKKENTKLIKCICGEEIRGEHRYQQHIVSEVHKNILRKRDITETEIIEPETEPDFLIIEDETETEAENLISDVKPTLDPVSDILTSFENMTLENKEEPIQEPNRTLNKDITLTKEERTDRNKARNKEKLKCVCGVEYSRSCQARHRESKVHKDYIEAHPEQAETNTKSGITCECGAVIGSGERNLVRHQTSEKHTKYMNAIKSGKSIEEFIQEEKDKIKAKDKARKSETILCECGTSYTKQHENRHKQTKLHIDFIHSKN